MTSLLKSPKGVLKLRSIWKIASWEVMRNVTNKQFILSLLLTPLLMAIFGGAPYVLERWNQPASVTYYLIDEIDGAAALQALLPANISLEPRTEATSIDEKVRIDKVSGYFRLTPEFLATGEIDLIFNDRNSECLSAVRAGLTALLQQRRLAMSEINPDQLVFLTSPARVTQVPMDKELDLPGAQIAASAVFTLLVFILIISSGSMLMLSALQEKRDRMAEVVLSSIRPGALMQGKIIGHFILGIIQMIVWVALGLPIAIYFLEFPVLEALAGVNFPVLLFFSLGGYLLFSSMFVALGATMEDAQSAGNSQGLVVMLPMLSMLFLVPVISNPDGTVAIFASFFPFTSPAIMMLRSGLTSLPLWQTLTSGAILLATAYLMIQMAAKIFRVGMLMYGKTATPKEILRWLRYKEG